MRVTTIHAPETVLMTIFVFLKNIKKAVRPRNAIVYDHDIVKEEIVPTVYMAIMYIQIGMMMNLSLHLFRSIVVIFYLPCSLAFRVSNLIYYPLFSLLI